MSDETKFYPWVDSEVDEAGDLHLISGLDKAKKIASCTVMRIKDRKIHEWLKSQGWASPKEKAELVEVMEELVEVWADSVDYSQPGEYNRYLKIIAKAKGEQG